MKYIQEDKVVHHKVIEMCLEYGSQLKTHFLLLTISNDKTPTRKSRKLSKRHHSQLDFLVTNYKSLHHHGTVTRQHHHICAADL